MFVYAWHTSQTSWTRTTISWCDHTSWHFDFLLVNLHSTMFFLKVLLMAWLLGIHFKQHGYSLVTHCNNHKSKSWLKNDCECLSVFTSARCKYRLLDCIGHTDSLMIYGLYKHIFVTFVMYVFFHTFQFLSE